jgi:hypothetical protein
MLRNSLLISQNYIRGAGKVRVFARRSPSKLVEAFAKGLFRHQYGIWGYALNHRLPTAIVRNKSLLLFDFILAEGGKTGVLGRVESFKSGLLGLNCRVINNP